MTFFAKNASITTCICAYHKMKNHEILELANYTTGKFKIHVPSQKCPQHTQNELDIFCNECQRLVCLDCAQKDHQDHKKGSLDEMSEEEKNELQNLMSGIDEALGKAWMKPFSRYKK